MVELLDILACPHSLDGTNTMELGLGRRLEKGMQSNKDNRAEEDKENPRFGSFFQFNEL